MENHRGESELFSPLSRENALSGPRARTLLHTPFAPFRVKPLSSGVTRVAAALWLSLRRATDVLSLEGWSRQSAAPPPPPLVCTQSQQPELPGSSLVNRKASEH